MWPNDVFNTYVDSSVTHYQPKVRRGFRPFILSNFTLGRVGIISKKLPNHFQILVIIPNISNDMYFGSKIKGSLFVNSYILLLKTNNFD